MPKAFASSLLRILLSSAFKRRKRVLQGSNDTTKRFRAKSRNRRLVSRRITPRIEKRKMISLQITFVVLFITLTSNPTQGKRRKSQTTGGNERRTTATPPLSPRPLPLTSPMMCIGQMGSDLCASTKTCSACISASANCSWCQDEVIIYLSSDFYNY